MSRNWESREEWNTNILQLTKAVREWNKMVFGNISYRKNRLTKILHGTARSLDHG